jgi:hypothetical protein
VGHKFLSTAAAVVETARDRGKQIIALFHVLLLFIGKKHDLSKQKISKNLSETYAFNIFHIFDESKKKTDALVGHCKLSTNCELAIFFLSTYENFIANFHFLGLFIPKNEFRAKKFSVCHAALPEVFGRNLRRS